jgi:hypothetical protein
MFNLLPEPQDVKTGIYQYKDLGAFEVYWMDRMPDETSLIYDSKNDRLSMRVENVQMTGKTAGDSDIGSVYSLVDFMPGLISAEVSMSNNGVCKRLGVADDPCERVQLIPAIQRMSIEWLRFRFPYPKEIRLDPPLALTCSSKDRHFLVLPLNDDVDSRNLFFGLPPERRDPAQVAMACALFKNLTYD